MLHQAKYLFCLRKLSKKSQYGTFSSNTWCLWVCKISEAIFVASGDWTPLLRLWWLLSFAPFFNTVAVDTTTILYERFQERWCCTNTPHIHHFFSMNMSLATLTKWAHKPYLLTQVSNTLSILKDIYLPFVHHVYNTQIITELHINRESLGDCTSTRCAVGWLKLVGCFSNQINSNVFMIWAGGVLVLSISI